MRIVLVSDWFLPRIGGIELHLRDLALHLMARGHDVHIVTPTPGPAVVEGIPVTRVHASRLWSAGTLFTRAGMRAVDRAVTELRPDVVHAHVSIVSPAAYAGASAAVRAGIPAVLTFHSVIAGLAPMLRVVGAALGTSRWPAVYTAVSTAVATPVARLAGTRGVTVLPNGIDPAEWIVKPEPRDPRRVEIVSVMRLNAKKRPQTLVRIMRSLVDRLPTGMTARLRIAGDGPQHAAVARLVRRLRLENKVELLGWQDRPQIRELLADADVFVMPSRFESFGLAALEARCAGVPVVAMARSGVREVIADNRDGLLARSDVELLEHTLRLATDRALRESIALHNRTTPVAARWSRTLDQLLALYAKAQSLAAAERVHAPPPVEVAPDLEEATG